MSLCQAILPEFDHEMANTRKVLERIPDDKLDWKVHEKSNTIGWVGTHLAEIPGWVDVSLNHDSLDVAPKGGEPYRTPPATSRGAILDRFDKNVSAARAAIAAASDELVLKPWSLLKGGEVLFTMPRIAVLRSFVLNHNIHHRAHLCVYLRLNGVPVPALYGPSADEDGM
ncbi:MAG: damage-inducible protein DinB [Rhodopirellula sp.]|nr:damage-inducible protein DinB [Rhodopirellula sp.]